MKMGFNVGAAILAAAALSACATSITEPVAVVSSGVPGGILRGTVTASLSEGGSFNVSNGKLSCAGAYDVLNNSLTISAPIICNDGRKGIVTATRNVSGRGGGGRFTLNDGTTGDFIFGPAALQL